MKLEVENASSGFSEQYEAAETLSDKEISELLSQGIRTAENGNRRQARQIFQQVVEADSKNEAAWLWLASIGEYPEEVLASLQHVLEINPQNERALELSAIARSLLAETFLHHGTRALEKNCRELASECFLRAVSYDSHNEDVWLQLFFLAVAPEEKTYHLQKVLDINPANETALSALESIKRETLDALMKKANSAAIAGEREAALQILEEVSQKSPDLEEAWILRAYLAESFQEKISSYEKVLQLNPENEAAQAGLFSLRALIEKTESQKPLAEAIEEAFENNNLLSSEDSPDYFLNSENASAENLENSFPEEIFFVKESVEAEVYENKSADSFEYFAAAEPVSVVSQQPDTTAYAEVDLLSLQEPEAFFFESADNDSKDHPSFELAVEPKFQETLEDLTIEFQADENSEFSFIEVDEKEEDMFSEMSANESPQNFQAADFAPVETFSETEVLNVEVDNDSQNFPAETPSNEFVGAENKVSTIMIVDDNPTILRLVSGKLEKSGYNVVPASDGEEALSKMTSVTPDLILLDITMPKMNGYQVCKIIRSHEETRNVPVLMISSRDGIFDERRGKMAGSTGFISKPFGPESLMRTVENYLR